jgi:hypothetical protein
MLRETITDDTANPHRPVVRARSRSDVVQISCYATSPPVTHTTVWNSGQTTLLITSPSSPAQTRGLADGHDYRPHMGCDLFAGERTPFRKSP